MNYELAYTILAKVVFGAIGFVLLIGFAMSIVLKLFGKEEKSGRHNKIRN